MGPIKAALESSVRYMASELGASGIRVHAVSPGPMPTRAGSGITDFDGLMDDAVTRSPLHRLGKPEDVGRLTAFLISDWAASQTGSQMFVDAGHHIMA
jgi:enoyl-[acyl-carrier protein] reductase I